jgi:hypothetical protein
MFDKKGQNDNLESDNCDFTNLQMEMQQNYLFAIARLKYRMAYVVEENIHLVPTYGCVSKSVRMGLINNK